MTNETLLDLPTDIATCYDLIRAQQHQIQEQHQLIQQLQAQVSMLLETVEALKTRLDQNSRNSHRPPSSDGFTKAPALPKSKKRPQGGQPGHRGRTLDFAQADQVHQLLAESCCCGTSLDAREQHLIERRQVFDLPEPRLAVTEYQRMGCHCPSCGVFNAGSFPDSVSARVQYGSGVRTLATLLNVSYGLSYAKTSQVFSDLFGYSINASTLVSAIKRCGHQLQASHEVIEAALQQSPVNHFDETGLRVQGRLHWLHSCSNADYTAVHAKRGRKALDSGLLPHFMGWAVHDCWASYFGFEQAQHVLCGAHLVRELRGVAQQRRRWARHFGRYLLALYRLSDQGRSRIPRALEPKMYRLYGELLQMGEAREPPPVKSKRGRPKATKGRNLLTRLRRHQQAVLAFAVNEEVPFTNNQAERDIRVAKIKQKIAGGFRTLDGAEVYARILSFISTARKQKRQVFKELRACFSGDTFLTSPKPS